MNSEFKEYVLAEIPALKSCKSYKFPIMLWRVRRYQPSYDAVYMLRYCLFYANSSTIYRKLMCKNYKRKLVHRYGLYCSCNDNDSIGKGLFLPHPANIIIGAGAKIGEKCIIYQDVTLGARNIGSAKKGEYPTLENNCVLFAGSKVIGGIRLAENTVVGANAVVIKDTEAGGIYAGIPARRVK